ncbi:S1C family serine protease [Paenibacillus koleovorans]|uniref:S1C family serine protease n=1 Tax=Paenibacillus koleovorans TaxID=121608 RepID=UPI000FD6C12F|nr:trypsin-like peptidase domain-containing protein [Paenibacillus koleovorans]
MDNNKRDFGHFFEGDRNVNGERRREQDHASHIDEHNHEEQQERGSYYYSYGPYRSTNEEQPSTTTASGESETSQVEITTPRPVRPIYGYSQNEAGTNNPQAPYNAPLASPQWDYNMTKKRFPLKSYIATFLAGAVVVASLMFASDKMDLFSSSAALSNTGNGGTKTTAVNGSGGDNGGATTAALNEIVRPGNISEIVEKSSGAVVKINTYVTATNRNSQRGSTGNDLFDYFFGNGGNGSRTPQSNGNNQQTPQRQSAGLGSGFIFDKAGYVLTNQHVVEGADEIEVEVEGYAKPFKAKLMGSEYSLDLAVLKIEDSNEFPYLPLGSSENMKVGDWVVAIGNPYGFDHTVTVGVFSARERSIQIPDTNGTRNYDHLIQTDASINPGNSGGPLLNLNGEVIGINTAVSAQAQGIGFAIPTSTVKGVLENLKNGVKLPQPFIGVGLSDIQDDWVKQLKLENNKGSVITQVESGSPASKAGLTAGDVILQVNGEAISNSEEVTKKIKALKPGDKVTLKIVRDGKQLDTFVFVGDRNATAGR